MHCKSILKMKRGIDKGDYGMQTTSQIMTQCHKEIKQDNNTKSLLRQNYIILKYFVFLQPILFDLMILFNH